MNLEDVFGISPGQLASYVERKADQQFTQYCQSSKHIVIFGSSKQGKTSLRKKNLPEDEGISVNCQSNWSLKNLYESILKRAGYQPQISEERKSAKSGKSGGSIKVKGSVPGLSGAVSVGGDAGEAQGTTKTFQTLEIDPNDPNDIILALKQINFEKWIVLDDFHYLPQDTQRDFAAALKAFYDESNVRFIIIAVWKDQNRISSLGDLALRCVSIDADVWRDDELYHVIKKGENALNISFPQRLKRDLVNSAAGSVYIIQEVCFRLCQEEEVFEAQKARKSIGRRKKVEPLIEDVISQFTGQFKSFFTNFSHGFQATELEMYRWLLMPVLVAGSEKQKNGIPLTFITSSIRQVHPRGKSLHTANIVQALKFTGALQAQQNIKPFILDYDESKRVLNIVDRSFILWLERQDRIDLLGELGLPESAIQLGKEDLSLLAPASDQ